MTTTTYNTLSKFTDFFILKVIGGYSADSLIEDLGIKNASLELVEQVKVSMTETEKAYYASPTDAEGETKEQSQVSDAILASGAREVAELLELEFEVE